MVSFITGRLILPSSVNVPPTKTLSPSVISHKYAVIESTPPLEVVKSTTAVSPLHKSKESTGSTWAVGFTVIVKVKGSPSLETPPFVKVGVTVIEVIKGSEVILSAVNPLIKPEPSSVWSRPISSPVATHS